MKVLKLIPVVFTISILVLAVPFSAFGIVYDPAIEILNPTPLGDDQFGSSVAIEGNNIMIGTPGGDDPLINTGNAYLYDSAGNLQLTLLNPSPESNDQFGASVAIDGNHVLVGATQVSTGGGTIGAAYLFDIATCDSDTSNGGIAGDNICESAELEIFNVIWWLGAEEFGRSVSINGNNVLIGAPHAGWSNEGMAFYYDVSACDSDTLYGGNIGDGICDGPTLSIQNPFAFTTERFGDSVVISGTKALIGSPEDTVENSAGAAYYYDIATCDDDTSNGGTSGDRFCEAALLTFLPPNPIGPDLFGKSISFDGNTLLVGAPWDDTASSTAGAAYLFDITSCDDDTSNGGVGSDNTCEAASLTILNPTPQSLDEFGISVSLEGSNALIGAWHDDTGDSNTGSVYLFDIATCDDDTINGGSTGDNVCEAANKTILNPTPVADDNFGISVSISGNDIVVGAWQEDSGASESGAAYLFLENAGGQATGTLTILGTCGLTFVGGNTIAYDGLEPGQTSTEKILSVQNTGTVPSNVLVSGLDWVDDTQVTVMLTGTTAYSNNTGDYASKTSLSGTPTQILDTTQYLPDTPVQTFWQVLATLVNPDFVGSLTQEMTFTVDC